MPSFDVVCEANMIEVKNAIEQSNKEISTRFDFKGSDARVEHKERELTLYADDDFKLGQVKDVMVSKMAKRNVDVRFLDYGKIEKIGGDKVKQVVTVKKGVSGDLSKKIVKPREGQQDQGPGEHSGRRGAHHRHQARRSAKRDRAAAQGCDGYAARLQQLPRLDTGE